MCCRSRKSEYYEEFVLTLQKQYIILRIEFIYQKNQTTKLERLFSETTEEILCNKNYQHFTSLHWKNRIVKITNVTVLVSTIAKL